MFWVNKKYISLWWYVNISMVDTHVYFERVQRFGRLSTKLAGERHARVDVEVADMSFKAVRPGEHFATDPATQACNNIHSINNRKS